MLDSFIGMTYNALYRQHNYNIGFIFCYIRGRKGFDGDFEV